MAETIGWWDYDETDRPTLVNRDSGEGLRMGEEVRIAGKRPGQRWIRFDYLHDGLEFPVLICWLPDEGRIVVDYQASNALWREEGSNRPLFPSYGTWVRLDDCLIDAIWSWPEVARRLHMERWDWQVRGWIARIGGWCNGAWRSELRRIDVSYGPWRSASPQYRLESLMPLEEPAPSPWSFIDVSDAEAYSRLGYDRWLDEPLFEDEEDWGDAVHYKTPGIYESGGCRTVQIRGMVPQMRSRDGARLLFPKSAYIIHKEVGYTAEGPADSLRFGYCRRAFGKRDLGVHFGRAGPWRIEPGEASRAAVWPSFRLHSPSAGRDSPEAEVSFVERPGDIPFQGVKGRLCLLSLSTERALCRDITDALLCWQGTDEGPELWGSSKGDYLSYEKPAFVIAERNFVGGKAAPVKTFATLGRPPEWNRLGFDLRRFT